MLLQDKNSSEISPAPKTVLETCKSWKFKCSVKWDGEYFFPLQIFEYLFLLLFLGHFLHSVLRFGQADLRHNSEEDQASCWPLRCFLSLRVSKRVKQLRIQCHAYLPLLITSLYRLLLDPTNSTPSESWALEPYPRWPNNSSIKMGLLMLFKQLFQHIELVEDN